ncbi:MAG TPA: glucose/galactose MFS transporter, partial [Anseongella sp.]|nr:glucose/galactose MFS transporter [Anseongella sp.]
ADAVIVPYIGIAVVVLLVAFLFSLTKMPEPPTGARLRFDRSIFRHKHLTRGVVAQFFYVGAQASIWGLTIDYVIHLLPGVSKEVASGSFLAIGTFLFVAGRFIGTFLMSYVRENRLLWVFALCAFLLTIFSIYAGGYLAVYSVLGLNFFMSIMFPTIFALGVKDLGEHTKLGSSLIIMAIFGGAALPPLVGAISDSLGIQISFWIPALCFLVVLYYGLSGYKIKEIKA